MEARAIAPDPTQVSPLRRRIATATVIVCLPYLALKVAWVAGLNIGTSETDFADTTRAANLLTAGLEVVAILLAIALVLPIGRRVPAFLVAFPMWVATGLLTPVVAGFALGTPIQLLSGGGNAFRDEVLDSWVFALVYGGFVLEAVLLTAGFVLHARNRWPALTSGAGRQEMAATGGLQRLLGGIFAVVAVVFAIQQASWALAGGGSFVHPEPAQRVMLLVGAAVAAAAAFVSGMLLRDGPLTTPRLAVLWTGTAVVFTDTLVETLKRVAIAPDGWGATSSGPGEATLTLFLLLGALAGSIGGAMRLVDTHERGWRAGDPAELEGQLVPGPR